MLCFVCGMAFAGNETARASVDAQESPVWFWNSGKNGPKMKLEVQLDQNVIFATSFTISHQKRSVIPENSHQPVISFSFKAERPIAWSGYRDENVVSPAKQTIKCDIWMAGADPMAIILGLDFTESNLILINTLHIAVPASEARSEIVPGLVIVTSPISEK